MRCPCGAPVGQFAGAVNGGMRGQNLLHQRGAGAQHSDDEYRALGWVRTGPGPDSVSIPGSPNVIDGLRQSCSVVLRPAQSPQLVRTAEIGEGLVEILHVIEIFSDGMA